MARYEAWDASEAAKVVAARANDKGAAIPIFHDLMDRFGYVDRSIVPLVAEALNLSRAEIHGTLTFYHDFRDHPPGRCTVKICRAEACQARGAVPMQKALMKRLGIGWHETTPDGAITLEPVFCLGFCANGPAALVDEQPVGALDSKKLDDLIEEALT